MNNADELIKNIATKNGIIVKEDDPIMVLHTANNTLLDQAETRLKKQQIELLNSFQAALDEISMKWTEETKQQSQHVLTATLQASQKAMQDTMSEGSEKVSVAMKEQIGRLLVEMGKAERSKKDLYMNYGAYFISGAVLGAFACLIAGGHLSFLFA